MAQQIPPPQYGVPPQRNRGPLVLVGVLVVVLVAVLAVGGVFLVKRLNEPEAAEPATKPATPEAPDAGGWVVNLILDDDGAKLFGTLTPDLATKAPPLNQVAIVVDGQVAAAPAVQSAIPGGKIQITGSTYTKQTAEDLAKKITG
jgi:preprotein translocase subunit SecD